MIYREEKKIFVFVSLLLPLATTATCPGLDIVSRSEWGARPATATWSLDRPVKHVIVGHTITAECLSLDSCANIMRVMQNYHMNLDWGDIGYNFAIGGDGRVYEGVGWPRQGIHTLGWNTKSYGIGFIGNFAKVKPNAKMLKAARLLIMCGIQKKFMPQSVELHGARDATCTESPGDALYKIIKQWPMFKGEPLEGYKC